MLYVLRILHTKIRLMVAVIPPLYKLLIWSHRHVLGLLANTVTLNYLCVAPIFLFKHKRLPRHPSRPNATFYDFIFHRMIRNSWTVMEESAVDKEYSKIIAAGLSAKVVQTPTVDVVDIDRTFSLDALTDLCRKYAGKPLVIKPTHSSGDIIFLRHGVPDKQDIRKVFRQSRRNFFVVKRETQYAKLKPKLIVEADISAEGVPPVDYKFFCCYGKPMYCQVDTSRFSDHRRELFVLPQFERLDVEYGYKMPDMSTPKPERLAEMLEIAAELSRPFAFVRIDLYETEKGIVFGEFTFSPCASTDRFSDEKLAIQMMKDFRQEIEAGKIRQAA